MRSYELTFLVSPEISPEQLTTLQEKIVSLVQEENGILGQMNRPIKKVLAYPIRKKTQAYLVSLNFQLNPEVLKNIEKKLKDENQILRYLILTKPIKRMIRIQKIPSITRVIRKPRIEISKPKVKLEEIEKKLEEILGE